VNQTLPDRDDLAEAARRFEELEPAAILEWAQATYAPRLALACSFGGPSGMVLLDMLAKAHALGSAVTVYYLETDLLFPETHELIDRVEKRYGIRPVAVKPELTVPQQAEKHGAELWKRDPDACCGMRKVEPQRAFLANFDAWITGLRRTQSSTRRATQLVEWDEKFGLAKINPLARWDDKQLWAYITHNDVPYNVLNDRGYPSVGCIPCTRNIAAGEDARAGRWEGFNKTECGLHA
jgi:phosphoadenosine phosphosulfate reductase